MELLASTQNDVKLWTAVLGLLLVVGMWLAARMCRCSRNRPQEPVPDLGQGQDRVQQLDALIADARRALADLLEATMAAVQEGVGSNLTAVINSAFEDKLAQPLKVNLGKLGKAVGAIHGLTKDGFPETKQAVLAGVEQLRTLISDNHAALAAAVDPMAQTSKDLMEKLVAMGRPLNGRVDDLHKHVGGTVGQILHLVKPMPGVVVAVKNLCEKITTQAAELKKPVIDSATICQDNRQILQRMREELTAVAEQLFALHGKIDGLCEAVGDLRDRVPERPPLRTPPATTVQTSPPTASTMPMPACALQHSRPPDCARACTTATPTRAKP